MTETTALKRPFLIGVLSIVIVVVLLGGLITVFGSTGDRPEGVAERWVTAVGDSTRKGIRADAEERVKDDGDLSLAAPLITAGYDYEGKAAFTALEVGRGKRLDADHVAVPMKLTNRADDSHALKGVLVLRRDGESWRVVELRPEDASLRVPSDGGAETSEAPLAVYAGGLLIGLGVLVAASALVRVAGREHERAVSAA